MHFSALPVLLDQFRLSMTSLEYCENGQISLQLLWGADRKSPLGYSGTHRQPPTSHDHPFPKWGLTTPSQNLHHKLQPNDARQNGGLY